jgi:uncharacterized protein (TIGR00725 family)
MESVQSSVPSSKASGASAQNTLQTYCRFKLCVSGAAETGHCAKDVLEKAKAVGREIVQNGGVLVTGATTGSPYWAAIGAKEAGGISIGLSPASSEQEHVERYKLPTDYFDVIIYTGFDYSGRNLLLTRAADGIIIICGRMGTLNEFTIAFEDHKPIGVLTGMGGTPDLIKSIIDESHREEVSVIYESDPKILVEKMVKLICKDKEIMHDGTYYQ